YNWCMHLYFLRHGQSEANASGIVSGQSIDSPLTDLGEHQAEQAAQWILDNNLKFDLIISSPAIRAKRTASIIAYKIGYPAKEILHDKDLTERYCGKYEGGPDDVYYEAPESVAVKEMEVEPLEDLHARVSRVLNKLKTDFPKKTILVVSH